MNDEPEETEMANAIKEFERADALTVKALDRIKDILLVRLLLVIVDSFVSVVWSWALRGKIQMKR